MRWWAHWHSLLAMPSRPEDSLGSPCLLVGMGLLVLVLRCPSENVFHEPLQSPNPASMQFKLTFVEDIPRFRPAGRFELDAKFLFAYILGNVCL